MLQYKNPPCEKIKPCFPKPPNKETFSKKFPFKLKNNFPIELNAI